MTELIPYLAFDSAKEALAYYEEVFGATDINRLPVGPEQAGQFGVDPAVAEDMTMHSEFKVAGHKLYAADKFGKAGDFNASISLSINWAKDNAEDTKAMTELFDRVAAHPDTKVEMPIGEQFWGGVMGALKDKYGVDWMFNGN
ncbi:VOC family protein [Macrococcus sp. DPC7161]|uniref:VOC family protein n=1 Tax=Macrococcus sp. DPC7161 TaxID=2507060 RepID=UPI00100B058A|nr:VOC family protein [Macrococcus sp. DPC7161]RXK17464.1 VOC family protein [Macrococcus sp. DPC7161]